MQQLLSIVDLHVKFQHRDAGAIHALNGVHLRVTSGTALGILGESGCGKSTLARALLRLLPAKARIEKGSMQFEGRDLLALSERELERIRGARISLIPQEAGLALNPLMKVGKQVAEVVRAHNDWSWRRCQEEAETLLRLVHLEDSARRMFDAYPHQLSGGQQQRVVIAQAISCHPALVVADEPTASLDAETEEEILQLLKELKSKRGLALLLITHDPKILVGIADRIAVMYAGRIVEEGSVGDILRNPLHPYAKLLISCIPPEPGAGRLARGERLPIIPGASPDAGTRDPGCTFAPRCPSRLQECDRSLPSRSEKPEMRLVECFLYDR